VGSGPLIASHRSDKVCCDDRIGYERALVGIYMSEGGFTYQSYSLLL